MHACTSKGLKVIGVKFYRNQNDGTRLTRLNYDLQDLIMT